jgi:nucleotide-binding universal stress UspA family protein
MFQKVLVAIDDSESSQIVFEQALALAKTNQSKLMLLHVLVPTDEMYAGSPYFGTPSSVMDTYLERCHQRELEGTEKLRKLELVAAAAGVSAESKYNIGDPGRLICALAKAWNADLILIGRRGLIGLNELFMGSVSNYVSHHAPCHVLTIQCGFHQQQHAEPAVTAASFS